MPLGRAREKEYRKIIVMKIVVEYFGGRENVAQNPLDLSDKKIIILLFDTVYFGRVAYNKSNKIFVPQGNTRELKA